MSTFLEELGNRLFEKISLHPAKNFLHAMLINDIEIYSKGFEVAADISSSHFANTEYFRSDQYIGVDIDRGRLRKGKAEFEDAPEYAAIQADIRRPLFHADSIGMIVSTHTLSHLDPDEHLPVVDLFVEYLEPGGCLLIQLADGAPSDEIETRLNESFGTVKRTDYYNTFSRLFRKWHSDDDEWYNPTMTGWRRYPNAAAIVILSLVERLRWPNTTFTYLKCTNKKPAETN